MKHLYRYLLLFLLLIVLLQTIALLFLGIEEVVSWWTDCLGLADKKALILLALENVSVISIVLPLLLLFIIGVVALYKQNVVIGCLVWFFRTWKEAFVNLFRSITRLELLAVIIIPCLASIYFAQVIGVSYDEAITYNLFTSKPFYFSMIFYPYPNNHVLHSLITNITEYIPFVDTLFAIRLPAIIASLFTWLIGYSFLRKYYSSRVALLVVGIASAMYMSIYYSFMSRGYAFMVLAFVVCLYAAFNIIHKGSKAKDWMFFVVAGILGCYAIPSFLYPLVTLNVLILIYNYKNIRQQIIANLILGLVVILLYLPIIVVDGLAALTSNQFVQHISRMDILNGILDFYRGMFADIAGVPYVMLLLIAIPFALTIFQKDRWHLTLWCVFLLAPFVLLMLHAVNPFYRTFLYYNFILAFLMVVPFNKYLYRLPKVAIILFVMIIQSIGVYGFNLKIRDREGFNTDAKIVADTYFKKENSIVFPCIRSANYEFEAKVRNLEGQIHFLDNVEVNADTINNVEYIIVEKRRDKTISKKPYQSIGQENIYKNIR